MISCAPFAYSSCLLQGQPQKDHPIKAELDRIKGYVQRLNHVAKESASKDSGNSNTDIVSTSSSVTRPETDISTAQRMITKELGIRKLALDGETPNKKRKKHHK